MGVSHISAPNTISDSSSSISLNFTGGFIFWTKNNNLGLTIQNTYKSVSDENMLSHNRISVGVKYKL